MTGRLFARTRMWWPLVWSLSLGCGGRTDTWPRELGSGQERQDSDTDDDSQPRDDPTTDEDDSDEPTSRGDDDKELPDSFDPDERQLEDCRDGFAPSEGSCDWLAADVCFSTKDDACDCICPRDRDSVCISGFFAGPNGKTEVHCK